MVNQTLTQVREHIEPSDLLDNQEKTMTVKILVNHQTSVVAPASVNAVPSIGSHHSVLEITGAPSEEQARKGVAESSHRFRIGHEVPDSTEFTSSRAQFRDAISSALIQHGATLKKLGYLNLQVLCPEKFGWRNLQNPKTGGVVAINSKIAGEVKSLDWIFDLACQAIAQARSLLTK